MLPLRAAVPPVLHLTLPDGYPVALRAVVPEDRDRLADGFDELSETSRRLRFLGSVSSLSPSALRYLTAVDHIDHVAWGVLDLADAERPGFGVGRFVRLSGEPRVAEFSLTVADRAQGRGVGQTLLALLCVIAPTVDIQTLRGVVGRENDRMVAWLKRLGATTVADGQDLVMDVPTVIDPSRSTSAAAFAAVIDKIRAAAGTLDVWPNGRVD